MTTISKCWVLRLRRYNYKVRWVKSHDNIADALSCLTNVPVSRKFCYDNEYVWIVALESVPVALKIQEIEKVSAEDEELQVVRGCLVSGNWEGAWKSYYVFVMNWLSLAMSSYVARILWRRHGCQRDHSKIWRWTYLDPYQPGEHLLVQVDYFSRWVEVDVIYSTTSEVIIKCLDIDWTSWGPN